MIDAGITVRMSTLNLYGIIYKFIGSHACYVHAFKKEGRLAADFAISVNRLGLPIKRLCFSSFSKEKFCYYLFKLYSRHIRVSFMEVATG